MNNTLKKFGASLIAVSQIQAIEQLEILLLIVSIMATVLGIIQDYLEKKLEEEQ